MTIKLFVGQIPKSFGDDDLREMFSEYNDSIIEVQVIRNNQTNEPRGCAFVTLMNNELAEKAINQLHNSKKFPGVSNNLQVKYADSEQEKLSTKLFVGMLPRAYQEDDVRSLFSEYGTVEDICILRGNNNQSKGCGFVKFQDRDSCLNAINALHGTRINPSPHDLVVKFADTEKDKKKRQQQQQQQFTAPNQFSHQQQMAAAVAAASSLPKMNHAKQQLSMIDIMSPYANSHMSYGMQFPSMSNPSPSLLGTPHPGLLGDGIGAPNMYADPYFDPNNMGGMGGMSGMGGMGGMGGMNGMGGMGGMNGMNSMGGMAGMGGMGGMNGAGPGGKRSGGMGGMNGSGGDMKFNNNNHNRFNNNNYNSPQNGYDGGGGFNNGGGGGGGFGNGMGGGMGGNGYDHLGMNNGNNGNNGFGNAINPSKRSQAVGPPGSNLFVYNIPPFYRDPELFGLFKPFGDVVSSKVFVDKVSGQSKGFGFVSFDNSDAAAIAITNLNGTMLNGKKLKVTVKQSSGGASNPY